MVTDDPLPGVGRERRIWHTVLFPGQSDFEHLNSLPVLRNQEISCNI